ncbi:MAG: hypothetical protein ACR2HR_15170, partial [Euzebya sp.]
MTVLTDLSVPKLAAAVRSRRIGAVELTQLALDSIAAGDEIINAVVHVDAAQAAANPKKTHQQATRHPDSLPASADVPRLIT